MLAAEGRLPEAVVACVGGGSNAIGMFAGFVDDAQVGLVGVEAAGAASLGARTTGRPPRRALVAARRRGRPDRSTRTRSRPGSTIRASAPSTRGSATPAGRATSARPTRRRSTPSRGSRGRRDHPGARARPRPRAKSASSTPSSSLVCLSGRGDKDLAQALEALGRRARVKTLVDLPDGGRGDARARRARSRAAPTWSRSAFPSPIPLADGPVDPPRGRAGARGRDAHGRCLECLAPTRALVGETPLVPMTYASLLEAYGWERFAADARRRRRDEPDRRRPARRRAAGAPPRPARRSDLDRRADRARRRRDRRLALPRHPHRHDRRARASSPPRSPASPSARGASRPTRRSTPASGSRRPSTPARRPRSRTASSSARAALEVAEDGPAALRDVRRLAAGALDA